VAQEPSIEADQQKGALRFWTSKALTLPRLFYQGLTWERLKAIVDASASNAAKLLWIAACILIVSFVVRDLSTDLVTIEPISVPKAFSESGYTPEVASHRLNDALSIYARNAGSVMQGPSVAARDELPKFVIPKIDLSLDTIVASVRGVLHYGSRRTISGELIVRGKQAWLRLRIDGQNVYSSPNGFDVDSLDELFASAVPDVMDKIRPYLIASTLYDHDPEKGVAKADEIIARLPDSDVNVEWSYILKGVFLTEQKKDYAEAENVLRQAISLNEGNSTAHYNLGNALREQGKRDEAMAEFRRAVQIDPKNSEAHNNLGNRFRDLGKLDDAIAEYRSAIKADPNNEKAKNNLERGLREKSVVKK
jgi:tetratricopeptide (TPR) repeat protein